MGEIVAAAVGHHETLQTALRFKLKLGRLLSPGGNHRVIRLSAVKLHSEFGKAVKRISAAQNFKQGVQQLAAE